MFVSKGRRKILGIFIFVKEDNFVLYVYLCNYT